MKKISFTFLFAFLFLAVSLAQIPNNSFENWTNMGAYNNPNQWGTMNNVSALGSIFTAEQGAPGNPGSYYLKLTSKTTPLGVLNGIAVSGRIDSLTMRPMSGFAFSQRPQSLTGKWQHMIYGSGNQGSVSASLTKWNSASGERDTIALLNETLVGMDMSWTPFSIDFTYQSNDLPDSCIIFLKANGTTASNLSFLYVDNLAFVGWVGIESNAASTESFLVFPNPSDGNMEIELNGNSPEATLIQLTDLYGNIVLSKNAGTVNGASKQSLNVSGLAKGTYLLNIISGKEKSVKKVVIQ